MFLFSVFFCHGSHIFFVFKFISKNKSGIRFFKMRIYYWLI